MFYKPIHPPYQYLQAQLRMVASLNFPSWYEELEASHVRYRNVFWSLGQRKREFCCFEVFFQDQQLYICSLCEQKHLYTSGFDKRPPPPHFTSPTHSRPLTRSDPHTLPLRIHCYRQNFF